MGNIREQDPLKQGLKHLKGFSDGPRIVDSRARSTKTRIETYEVLLVVENQHIREQDPLKQGLKLT